jgi:hypothetical protein
MQGAMRIDFRNRNPMVSRGRKFHPRRACRKTHDGVAQSEVGVLLDDPKSNWRPQGPIGRYRPAQFNQRIVSQYQYIAPGVRLRAVARRNTGSNDASFRFATSALIPDPAAWAVKSRCARSNARRVRAR